MNLTRITAERTALPALLSGASGIGKTAAAVNLGGGLAGHNKKVCRSAWKATGIGETEGVWLFKR